VIRKSNTIFGYFMISTEVEGLLKKLKNASIGPLL
jgi:hypothetical protein